MLHLFEGLQGRRVVSMRLDLLREGHYRLAGLFIKWSLQQGGPGIPIMELGHYKLIVGHTGSMGDVEDEDIEAQEIMKKVGLPRIIMF